MLMRFEVENFKGFSEKFTMDLSGIKSYEFNDECIKDGVARFAQCYGPNGSGKSNFGLAVLDVVCHLTDFNARTSHYSNYLNANSNSNATFSYTFKFSKGTVKYEYTKSSQSTPLREELWICDDLVISLDRETGTTPFVSLMGAESLVLNEIKNSKISIVKFIAKNSILAKNNTNELFGAFLDFIEHMLYFRSLQDTSFIGYKAEKEHIPNYIVTNDLLGDLQSFLESIGINYKLVSIDDSEDDMKNIGVVFGSGKENRTKNFTDIASTGTKALTTLFYWFNKVKSQDRPSLIFIDEFDAFYHFKLSETVTKMLRGLVKHQVILTSHNTGLLSNEISRPDCNFIINKNEMSPLYELTEKELRSAHNIEKIYRAGGFGEG
jgi:AAA15 family ATPase/GTPase